jgi:hypothetical protein
MISANAFLQKLEKAFPQNSRIAAFPFLYIEVTTNEVEGLDDADREDYLAKSLGMDVKEFRESCQRLFFRIDAVCEDEKFLPSQKHWFPLGVFSSGEPNKYVTGKYFHVTEVPDLKSLPEDVLVVDAAMMLSVADAKAENCLIGARAGVFIGPYIESQGAAVIPFGPSNGDWDIEISALMQESNLYPLNQRYLIQHLFEVFYQYSQIIIVHSSKFSSTYWQWKAILS